MDVSKTHEHFKILMMTQHDPFQDSTTNQELPFHAMAYQKEYENSKDYY